LTGTGGSSTAGSTTGGAAAGRRARARELGLAPGTLPPGPWNAITDVAGIRVGHATVIQGSDIRTGVTAIVHDRLLPGTQPDGPGTQPDGPGTQPAGPGTLAAGPGTLAAGLSVFNGFGKMTGSTQVAELGTIETPVLLTATLSVFRVADALLTYLHERYRQERQSPEPRAPEPQPATLNPVVAETNDSYLSDIWARPITAAHVRAAVAEAAAGPVAEGCVGAGTGTSALGFKAGIGTSSRVVPTSSAGPVTLGVLVQANFGSELTVLGVPIPVAQALAGNQAGANQAGEQPQGNSCVIVLATDLALNALELRRVASRAFAGMARAGSDFSGRSGDYALAISTGDVRAAGMAGGHVPGKDLDLLFTAAIEATEEAILNSLFMATTTTGYRGHVRYAVPLDYVLAQVRGSGG
jgi:D-aminopeptidase